KGIQNCFTPLAYDGNPELHVTLHLAYNGMIKAVNGRPHDLSPNQARCILRRAWNYKFPQITSQSNTPSTLEYRIQFKAQKEGLPDTKADQAQLLLERVTSTNSKVQKPLEDQLFNRLSSSEKCATQALRQTPMDLIIAEIDINWRLTPDQ